MKRVMTSPAILGVIALGAPGALAALAALSGCNATPVQVQAQNADGTVSSSAPATPSAAGSPSASSSSSDSSKVFFERILTDGTQLDQVIAIGFSAQDSQTTTPNGIALKTPQSFSPSPILAPMGDQVVYLQSDGLVSDSLVSTALGTLATEPLYDYPTQVVAMSFSPSWKTAWIDETGNVSVTDLTSGDSQAIPLPSGVTATSIQLSSSGSSLFVLTSGNDLLVYELRELGQTQWTQVFQAASVTAAALGGVGSGALAYVQSGKLYRFELPTAGSVPSPILVTALQSETVYDLTWSQDMGSVLYWAPLSAGEGEIRRVIIPSTTATSNSVEQSLARISVPSGITSGVVCPTWVGHTLYFSEFAQGEYQIESATPDTRDKRDVDTQKEKEPTLGLPIPFAVPPASDEGFICPIGSRRSVP